MPDPPCLVPRPIDRPISIRAVAAIGPYPRLPLSNTNLRLPKIFSNNASDSNSSTIPSVFDLSSESESESKDKSEDKLALEDKEKIKRGSKITGFAEVAKLYYLRYSVTLSA
ncbi:hypothetical protein N7537_010167 [Penicillium hordei]|uniref:Uncharacterized protein n=1 Tax=Penicillium hordei TaxID=40994 RepID=A0AAD6GWE2_9EURO|nr:uncharacterized protein N7537_010167 [Penicillium hordei]KAJ5593263.1 hypothetical protein N7537_010167 [Penicillium hordei]